MAQQISGAWKILTPPHQIGTEYDANHKTLFLSWLIKVLAKTSSFRNFPPIAMSSTFTNVRHE
jgi:hypothetical protein